MSAELSCEGPERSNASPAARPTRRRSFSRKSLPQTENSKSVVEYDRDSSSALVSSIFGAAKDALSMVCRELDLKQEEYDVMRTKLQSLEEKLGSRGGPIESALRSLVALQDGLCPPKRLKTDSDDSYVRTLQQTLNDWDTSRVKDLLSELTLFEPLPMLETSTALNEALDTAPHAVTEDALGVQLEQTQTLLTKGSCHEKLMQKSIEDYAKSLVENSACCITPRNLMEQFTLYRPEPNKVA